MAITVPANGDIISASTFGIPVANAVNAVYPQEIAFNQWTSNVVITASTEASAQQIIQTGSFAYDGKPVMLEFYCSNVQCPLPAGGQLLINLWDNNVDYGRLAQLIHPGGTAPFCVTVLAKRRWTPSVGNHDFSLRGWLAGGGTTAQISAGAGTGTGMNVPMFVRVTRA